MAEKQLLKEKGTLHFRNQERLLGSTLEKSNSAAERLRKITTEIVQFDLVMSCQKLPLHLSLKEEGTSTMEGLD